MKVLSRKPTAPKPASGNDVVKGIAQLGIEESDDEDDGDKKQRLSPEEMMQKAQKDREEKQRRYEEVRERLFGTGSAKTSGETATPKPQGSGAGATAGGSGDDTEVRKGRGRGGNRNSGPIREAKQTDSTNSSRSSSLRSKPRQSPSTEPSRPSKQLYDPYEAAAKPSTGGTQRRVGDLSTGQENQVQQPIRAPKGPDGSGRGGFGFVARGRGTA